MKRILVFGGSGMLGHKLVHVLSSDSNLEVHCTVREAPAREFAAPSAAYHKNIDARSVDDLSRVLAEVKPDLVLNAIGAIKQKTAPGDIAGTFFVNGTLPHLFPLLAGSDEVRVVHFSTDCVFKGDRGGYTEADVPDAEDIYGRSKACGEIGYGRHLTIRTSIVGFELTAGSGLLSWLFARPRGSEIEGYHRAIFSGLPTSTLAHTVRAMIVADTMPAGILHVASNPIDKFALLSRVIAEFGLELTVRPSSAVVINRSLEDSLFRESSGTKTPDWDALVPELVADFNSLPYRSVYPNANGK